MPTETEFLRALCNLLCEYEFMRTICNDYACAYDDAGWPFDDSAAHAKELLERAAKIYGCEPKDFK